MSWTEERVELLKKLWTDGLSASQIAAELGEVTRNAVIGKVHRLGLSGRAKTVRTTPSRVAKPRRPSAPRAGGGNGSGGMKPAMATTRVIGNTALKAETVAYAETRAEPVPYQSPKPVEELVVPSGEGISILELTEQTCKWPIGDPTTDAFHFCGSGSKVGSPYCDRHSRLAYQPVNDRRRKH